MWSELRLYRILSSKLMVATRASSCGIPTLTTAVHGVVLFVAKFEFLFQKGLNFGAVPHARSNWSIIFGGASGAFSLVYISVFIATQCQVNSRVLELTFHNNMRPVKKGRKIGCPSMRPMKKRPQDRLYVYEAFEKRPHILGCLRRLLIGLYSAVPPEPSYWTGMDFGTVTNLRPPLVTRCLEGQGYSRGTLHFRARAAAVVGWN